MPVPSNQLLLLFPLQATIVTQGCGCTTRIVCAREGSGRTCNGDSGSFMGVQQGGRWVQHGITSFGFSGCPTGDNMGFTEVCNFVNTIAGQAPGSQIVG